MSSADQPRLTFKPTRRLGHAREFARVYGARVKKSAHPLMVFMIPNALPHHRLGLSIGRRVGPAVRRSLLKRHVREAFRLSQHHLPVAPDGTGYDIVVGAVAHDPLALPEYKALLARLVEQGHRVWEKRGWAG